MFRLPYTIFVFDEALVIAPAGSFERLRLVAGFLPGVVGPAVGMVDKSVAKKEAAKREHDVEELPPDITVEQLVERVDNAHSVPTADIASLLLKSKLIAGAYLHVRFASRDVDRYVRKRLHRQRQLLSDPKTAGALLTQVFGDKVVDKRWGQDKD